jgi:nucleoside-diphosphate-sugar epimerase
MDVHGIDCGLYEKNLHPAGAQHMADFDLSTPATSTNRDMRDLTRRDVEGFDAVIHLAGLSNDPLGDFNPALTAAINCAQSIRLAKLAKSAGVRRFVFASSCSVYGAGGDEWLSETAPCNPLTAYADSKINTDTALAALASHDFIPVSLRGGTVFGASPRTRFDLVINNMTAWAIATGKVLLKSDGLAWRPVVHVRDVARVFAAVLQAPASDLRARVFNLSIDDQNLRIGEIARLVCAAREGTKLSQLDEAEHDQRSYRVSGARLRSLMGDNWWHHPIEPELRTLYTCLSSSPIPPEDFEGPRYQRLTSLRASIRDGQLSDDLRRVDPASNTAPERQEV